MDTTHSQASVLSARKRRQIKPPTVNIEPLPVEPAIKHAVHWVIKERQGEEWVQVKDFWNTITNFGLTALAGAPSGAYTPPVNLVIDSAQTTITTPIVVGGTTVVLSADPTISGDNQLVLSVGLPTQETVTFISKSGTTFTLSTGTVNAHNVGEFAVRNALAADTMSSVLSEAQYDPTFFPNTRVLQASSYSPNPGQNTMQFFISGLQATNLFFGHVGLADTATIGTGNLHNYAPLGYNHNNTNDLEIDVTYTLAVGSPSLSFIYYNVKDQGAVGNGTNDDTSAIQNTINLANASGGVVFLPAGKYLISTPLTMSSSNVTMQGTSGQGSVIQPSGTFSGAQVILMSADFTSIRDITIAYANTTYSGNPVATGIQITGARSTTLFNVYLNYIDGWAVQSSATNAIANYWAQFINVHTFQCAQGIHIIGASGSSFNMAHSLTNCVVDQCQNSDGVFIEDAHDVLITNLEGSCTAGTGSSLHIKGASAAVYVSNIDLGPAPGPAAAPTVLIESGTNGTPKQVTFNAGILEGGLTGITITAGTQLRVVDCDIINNGTHGINISGATDAVVIEGCLFNANGSTAGSARYDFNSSTTGHVEVNDSYFLTPQGSLTQQTNNAINVTAGNVVCQNDAFTGTGYNSGNIFLGFPKVVRACPGYNPTGNITVTVPASGTAFAIKSTDLTYHVTGGTVSAIAIGGTNTGLTSGTFRVPATQTFTITYTVVPTVTAFSD